jgi:hypothetical protein
VLRINAASLDANQPVGGSTQLREDLTFEMTVRPGRFGWSAFGDTNWRVRRVSVNGVAVGDSGLDVAAGTTVANVIVDMTGRHAEVKSGRIVTANGQPAHDYTVVMFPQDSTRWALPTRWLGGIRADADGASRCRLQAVITMR